MRRSFLVDSLLISESIVRSCTQMAIDCAFSFDFNELVYKVILEFLFVSNTICHMVGNKRTSTLPNNPPRGKREFAGISRPLPNVVSRNIPLQTKNIETCHANVSDNTRNEPMSTTMAHNIGPNKEEHASRERDQNTVHINALRSDVNPSSSVEKSTKDLPQKSLNPGLQATSMKSSCNIGKIVVEKKQISPIKAEIRASQDSTLRVSRVAEPKLKPLNSMLAKGPPLMRRKEQGLELQGKMVFKRNPSVDTKNQTPSTPTLKRKTFEGMGMGMGQVSSIKGQEASRSSIKGIFVVVFLQVLKVLSASPSAYSANPILVSSRSMSPILQWNSKGKLGNLDLRLNPLCNKPNIASLLGDK